MKRTRRAFFDHLYRCIGENYIQGIELGYCCEIMRLIDWFMMLFPDYTEDEVIEKYGNYSKEYFIDYVYIHAGKRLEKA